MEEKSVPVQNTPVQLNTEKKAPTKKSVVTIIAIIIAILLILSLFCGMAYIYVYLYWKDNIEECPNCHVNQPSVTTTIVLEPSSVETQSPTSVAVTETPLPTPESSDMNIYINSKYGFSFEYPKSMYHSYGNMCKMVSGSYRPNGGIVPVKIFEDSSQENVYVSSEYFYNMAGKTTGSNGVSNFSQCNRITNSYDILDGGQYFENANWHFRVKTVNNDSDIDAYIKANYGSGCSLGSKTAASQTGVYDIKIQGDGKEMEDTECFIDYVYVIKYSPAKKLLVNWDVGQSVTFVKDDSWSIAYDQYMIDSFKFN